MEYTDEQGKIDPRAHIYVRPRDVELGVSLDHNVVIDVFAGYKSPNAKLQVGMDFVARTHNNDLYACAAVLKVGAIGPIKTIGIVVMGTPLGTAVELNNRLGEYDAMSDEQLDETEIELGPIELLTEGSIKGTYTGQSFLQLLSRDHHSMKLSRWRKVLLEPVSVQVIKFCQHPTLTKYNTVVASADGRRQVAFGERLSDGECRACQVDLDLFVEYRSSRSLTTNTHPYHIRRQRIRRIGWVDHDDRRQQQQQQNR